MKMSKRKKTSNIKPLKPTEVEANEGQTITFNAKAKKEELHTLNQEAKKDTQKVTNEELEKLLPMMAGKPITEEENDWAEELMKRDVNLGAVIQSIGIMLAPTKEYLLDKLYILLDNQDLMKRVLKDLGATDELFKKHADEIVKERDEAREKAQELAKQAKEDAGK